MGRMTETHRANGSLSRLATLDALLRTKSPTRAARELGVTQSAVSKLLAALRRELGDRLLIRRGDRMVLTPRAERIARSLSPTLRDLEAMLRGAEPDRSPSLVTIAMRDQFAVTIGPRVLEALAREGTATTLRIAPYDRELVSDQLARGAIDLAVAVDPPERSGLHQTVLYRETFVCLTPSKSPPTLRQYLATAHVVTTAHAGYGGVDAALAKLGQSRRVVAEVPYFAAAVHMAEARRLFLTVPARVARALPTRTLHAHPVPLELAGFQARLVWDARVERDPQHEWLRDLVRAAASTTA